MLILGMDTATARVTVAIGRDGEVVAEVGLDADRRHAETLVPAIEGLAREAGVPVDGFDAFAVGVGPGLFTGLRVGVTTARTLAQVLGRPLIGVSSLDLVASPVPDAARVVAVVDARRREVFTAPFVRGADGSLVRSGADEVLAPAQLARRLREAGQPVCVAGDGALVYEPDFLAVPGVTVADRRYATPSAAVLVRTAAVRLARGEGEAPEAVLPRYLRKSDAEIVWDAR